MSTKIEAENIVQSLLNGVNEVTGNQDTNLTDGINSLIEGYGQGGSGSSGGINNKVTINSVAFGSVGANCAFTENMYMAIVPIFSCSVSVEME